MSEKGSDIPANGSAPLTKRVDSPVCIDDKMGAITKLLALGDTCAATAAFEALKKSLEPEGHTADQNKDVKSVKEKKARQKHFKQTEDSHVTKGQRSSRDNLEFSEAKTTGVLEELPEPQPRRELPQEVSEVSTGAPRPKAMDKKSRSRKKHVTDPVSPGTGAATVASSSTPSTAVAVPAQESTSQTPLKVDKAKHVGSNGKLKLPQPPPGTKSLASFGFNVEKKKKDDEGLQYLFSPFVMDKRIVPTRLQFWSTPSVATVDEIHAPDREDDSVRCLSGSSRNDGAVIMEHVLERKSPCPCGRHSHSNLPPSANSEVVYCGFHAVGYDPCQARPSYFGTYNVSRSDSELRGLAQFPAGKEMPRLSNIDYDYDSGDDWDHLDNDEDIEASDSSEEDEEDDDDDDDSFIDDNEVKAEDSDEEQQNKVLAARQRRLERLKGKDRLVPSFSGPFSDLALDCHPMRTFDILERLIPFTHASVTAALIEQLSLEDLMQPPDEQALGLKNKREMNDEEINEMHRIIALSTRMSTDAVVDSLLRGRFCLGVANACIRRTIKRFYEKRHGMFLRRDAPWSVADERLFKTKRREQRPAAVHAEDGLPITVTRDDPCQRDPSPCVSLREAIQTLPDMINDEKDCGDVSASAKPHIPEVKERSEDSPCGFSFARKRSRSSTAEEVIVLP
jgi:hypothetical protein